MGMSLRAKRLDSFACPACGTGIIAEGMEPFAPITCPKCGGKTKVPVKLGHFLLMRAIESAPSGRLFHAQDETLGRSVRVLVLREAGLPAVRQELSLAKFLSRIPCQGIPRVLSLEEIDRQTCLVFEYTGLPSLERLVAKQGALPPARALAVAAGAARVLHHAAASGLAHMDLTPANLLIGPEDEVWVRGFSPLNFAETMPPEGWIPIRSRWHAPEARTGEIKPGTLQDMWSLGAILEFTLTGRRSDEGDPSLDTVGLPVAAIACVRRLCDPWAEGRFGSWDEAMACLKSAVDEILLPPVPTAQAMPQVVEPTPVRLADEPTSVTRVHADMEGSSAISLDPLDSSVMDVTATACTPAALVSNTETSAENPPETAALPPQPDSFPALEEQSADDFAMDFGALLAKDVPADVLDPVDAPQAAQPSDEAPEAQPEGKTEERTAEPAEAEMAIESMWDAEQEPEAEDADFEEPVFDFEAALNAEAEAKVEIRSATPAEAMTPNAALEADDTSSVPAMESSVAETVAETMEEMVAETVPTVEAAPAADESGPEEEIPADEVASQPVPPPEAAPAFEAVPPAPAEMPTAPVSLGEEPPADGNAAKKLGLHTGLSGDQMSRLKGFKKPVAAPAPAASAPAPVAETPPTQPADVEPAHSVAAQAPVEEAAPLPTELPAAPVSFGEEPPPDEDAAKKLGLHTGLSGDQMSRLKGFKKKPAVAASAQEASALPLTRATESGQPANIEPEPQAAGGGGAQKNRMQLALAKLKSGAGAAAAARPAPIQSIVNAADAPAAEPPAEEAPATLPEVHLPMEMPSESGETKKLGLHQGLSGDQMAKLAKLRKKPQG